MNSTPANPNARAMGLAIGSKRSEFACRTQRSGGCAGPLHPPPRRLSDAAIMEIVVALDIHWQEGPVVAPAFVLRQLDLLLSIGDALTFIDRLLHRARQLLQVAA